MARILNGPENCFKDLVVSLRFVIRQSVSTERQFLSDFVMANERTAGGRLARWLSPASYVEPDKCEIKPPALPARTATRVNLPIVIRDQYGDVVIAPALKVEVST
ncbi:hypothetical protein ACJJTC_009758 [Scirpophaga incertulas]